MRTIVLVMILAAAERSVADDRPRLRGGETPRATDLLHAKRLAERVEKRLAAPRAHGPGWRHGGEGWNSPPETATAPDAPVTIHFGQPRRRRRAATNP